MDPILYNGTRKLKFLTRPLYVIEILEVSTYPLSIWQGQAVLCYKHVFKEIIHFFGSERCLYQNQIQVKNDLWNQDGNSYRFPPKFKRKALSFFQLCGHSISSELNWKLSTEGKNVRTDFWTKNLPMLLFINTKIFLYPFFYQYWQFLFLKCQP